MIAASEDPVQSLHECWDLPVQQARLEIVEELQGRQQGVDLGRDEPETCEFIPTEIYALLTTLQLLNNLQPGLLDGQEIVEELQGRQQGEDLGRIEPETWEFIPWPRPRLPEAIPV